MKATEKIVSNAIRRIISDEEYGWPPECGGVFYQPERPVQQKEAHTANEAQKLAADEGGQWLDIYHRMNEPSKHLHFHKQKPIAHRQFSDT